MHNIILEEANGKRKSEGRRLFVGGGKGFLLYTGPIWPDAYCTCNNERSKLLPQKRKKSCCFVAVASSGAMNFPSPRCCSKQKMDRLLLFFGSPPQNERPREAKATPTDSTRVRWREKKRKQSARLHESPSFYLSIAETSFQGWRREEGLYSVTAHLSIPPPPPP